MKLKIPPPIAKIAAKLTPRMSVGGLQVADGLVRYHSFGGGKQVKQLALRLPPGVVKEGKVANKEALVEILSNLRRQIAASPRKKVSVVLTIPIDGVYVQPFNLPAVATESIPESARLNMEMISPIKIGEAYYDWQRADGGGDSNRVELTGAFAAREVIDGFVESAQEAGYSVAVVEFTTLGLVRAARRAGFIQADKPYLLLDIGAEGLSFALAHRGSLFFHHFMAWHLFREGGKSIDIEKLKRSLADEVRRVVNFYSTNRKTSEVKDVLLIGTNLIQTVQEVIVQNFPGTTVQTASPAQLNPAMGSAYRGLIPLSQDDGISLASLSAVDVFERHHLENFLVSWRNIMFTVGGFMLALFLASAVVVQRTAAGVSEQDPFLLDVQNSAELIRLEQQAQQFNNLVKLVSQMGEGSVNIYPLLDRINELTGAGITLTSIKFQVASSRMEIGGNATAEARATQFKNTLSEQPQFKEVSLPLANLAVAADGSAKFVLNAKVVNLDFSE